MNKNHRIISRNEKQIARVKATVRIEAVKITVAKYNVVLENVMQRLSNGEASA